MFEKFFENRNIDKFKKKIKYMNSTDIKNTYINQKEYIKNNVEICDIIFEKSLSNLSWLPVDYQLSKNFYIYYQNMSNEALEKNLVNNLNDNNISEYLITEKTRKILFDFLINNLGILKQSKYKNRLLKLIHEYDSDLLVTIIKDESICTEELLDEIFEIDNSYFNQIDPNQQIKYVEERFMTNASRFVECIKYYKFMDKSAKSVFLKNCIKNDERLSLIPELLKDTELEVQKEVVYLRFGLLKYFDSSLQKEVVKEIPETISFLSPSLEEELLLENPLLEQYINTKLHAFDILNRTEQPSSLSYEKVVDKITLNNGFNPLNSAKGSLLYVDNGQGDYDVRLGLNQYTPNQKKRIQNIDIHEITNLILIDVNYILPLVAVSNENEKIEVKEKLKIIFSGIYGLDYLNMYLKIIDDVIDNYNYDCTNNTRSILDTFKLIFNKQIIINNNPNIIIEYINMNYLNKDVKETDKNNELFKEIIKNSYGNDAFDIVNSRNNLNEHNINSLEIFDKRIIDFFGEELIHDLITYNVYNMSGFLSIVKDEKKFIHFKDYYILLTNIYGKNIETFQKAVLNYEKIEELLYDIDNKELSSDELNQLYNVIINNNFGNIKTKNELINYQTIVKNKLDKKMEKTEDIHYLKDIICMALFGKHFNTIYDNYSEGTLSDIGVIYDIANSNNSELLNNNEKIMLSYANLLMNTTDVNLLKEFINSLFTNEDILCCDYFISGADKIIKNQEKIVNDSLISIKKIQEEVQKGTEKAFYKEYNGAKIYILNGMDYSILGHMIGIGMNNEYLHRTSGNIENFLELEEQFGSSTISTTYYNNFGKFGEIPMLGFSIIPESGLLQIAQTNNASTEHAPKLVHSWGRSSPDTKHLVPNKSEVAIYRYERKEDNVKNANGGGRIKPDFIIVGGNYTSDSDIAKIVSPVADISKQLNIPILFVNNLAYTNNIDIVQDEKVEERGISK